MRKRRFTEEQIISLLKESEAGAGTKELCRKHGISEQTFYRRGRPRPSLVSGYPAHPRPRATTSDPQSKLRPLPRDPTGT
jgi:transposase-like protein